MPVDEYNVIASVAFIGISAVLFVYWFRYTCLMILSSRPAHDFARTVADAYGLSFMQIQATLADRGLDLDALQNKLDSDYALVMRLMSEYNVRADALEAAMLKGHYALMRGLYGVTRHLAPMKAREALAQMADTVSHFAAIMGEQAAGA